ncbi:C40 family peptidase [Nonomuraea muscovyensis]|uniref:Cell wall-associated NlpC family hydrolase n=1 Tax=Nonomuraea muscovyensis TaxID=1124761 RepID=A0A7X0F137_9ACTN|nr:C40 family peptidase [Nonomuraea muscovyensis]MBB6351558.1 cell wall-associated NlpC family hydrolase [Nonomuraea muscovyensis]
MPRIAMPITLPIPLPTPALIPALAAAVTIAGLAAASPAAAAAPATVASPAVTSPAAASPTVAPDPEGVTLTGADVKRARTRNVQLPAWKIAVRYALDKQGTPYVWGGTSTSGYDCSGLMLRAYQAAGIELPRVAASQYGAFSRKIAWKDLRPGDLVFFHGLGHVGMISRPGHMVHAPRTGDVVKEERLDAGRRSSFVGAVRPDPKGVKRWAHIRELRQAPPPAMPVATTL